MANGVMLFFLVAYYSTDSYALRWIVSVIPVLASIGTTVLTWIGFSFYSEQMAKISVGSYLRPKKGAVSAVERKGSI